MRWQVLKNSDYYWDVLYSDFHFKPTVYTPPPLQPPVAYIEYDISMYFDEGVDVWIDDLNDKALLLFQALTEPDESVVALDWQHKYYRLFPHQQQDVKQWKVSALPDGDYYFFVAEDFSWGWLGHPWRGTVTVFGYRALTWLNDPPNRPALFLCDKKRL